jgi:hypothetical protein
MCAGTGSSGTTHIQRAVIPTEVEGSAVAFAVGRLQIALIPITTFPSEFKFSTTISKCERPSLQMKMRNDPSRRRVLRLVGITGICGAAASASTLDDKRQSSCDHIAWVVECLERMLTIKSGMTRYQLMKIFSTEGGISTAKQRTYVSRDCPYFKVEVKFRRAADSGIDGARSEWIEERDDDVITSISGPFLQFSIMD